MKILALPLGNNGCTWIRVVSIFDKINQLGLADCKYVLPNDLAEFEKYADDVVSCSDVILWRHGHEEILQRIISEYDCSNKIFIYDSDDNDFESPYWQEMYRYFGTEDVWYNDKKTGKQIPLWVDKDSELGKTSPPQITYDRAGNKAKLDQLIASISMSNAVFVTQEKLAEIYRPYNPNVFVLPNAIDFDLFKRPNLVKNPKEIRIGWTGGCSHYADFYLIKDWLKDFIKSHKETKLVLVGDPPVELFKDIKSEQLEVEGWVSPDAHPYRLALLNIDIAVIPLKGTKFDRCKSSHKYSEFSAMGIPSLASRTTPYREVITDGVNGFLFSTKQEFMTKLETLCSDRLIRAKVGQTALDYIKTNFNSEKIAKDYIKVLQSLLVNGGKDELRTDKK